MMNNIKNIGALTIKELFEKNLKIPRYQRPYLWQKEQVIDLIEDLSTVFTLEAGDIIATGTPAGVGAGRDPQEWMYDGDVVEATVEGIGTIVNTIREI